MATLDVDFDVFKKLTVRRKTEAMTCNDVIRELLELPPVGHEVRPSDGQVWIQKGVSFPNGTMFRAIYKGVTYIAEVKYGRLELKGEPMNSLSEAANFVTNTTVNGWRFWHLCLALPRYGQRFFR